VTGKLQKRFVFTAMTAITILIGLIVGAINVSNIIMVRSNIDMTINMIANESSAHFTDDMSHSREQFPGNNDGKTDNVNDAMPEDIPIDMPDKGGREERMLPSPYFVVKLDNNNDIIDVDTSRIFTIDEATAQEIAEEALKKKTPKGKIEEYKFLIVDNGYMGGRTAVFLDAGNEISSYFRVMALSIGVGILGWILMLLIVICLSGKAIRPFVDNIERQKQFITNAGHEIKTPLAIIQSNADALELYQGESKWSKNIKNQVKNLNNLMGKLLELSRMDEKLPQTKITEFLINDVVNEIMDGFEEPFALKGINIEKEIQDNAVIKGDREQIVRLISILLDNALKYTNDNGKLMVSLKKKSGTVILCVKNTCERFPEVEPGRLFDRFYRGDKARGQNNGGYGIGLSMAETIVNANHGKIYAIYEQPDTISFVVEL